MIHKKKKLVNQTSLKLETSFKKKKVEKRKDKPEIKRKYLQKSL